MKTSVELELHTPELFSPNEIKNRVGVYQFASDKQDIRYISVSGQILRVEKGEYGYGKVTILNDTCWAEINVKSLIKCSEKVVICFEN